MGSQNNLPMPPRRPPWRSGLGTPHRRRSCDGGGTCARLAWLAPGLALCCAASLSMSRGAAPEVALDDGDAALACDTGRVVQGRALALPAAQVAPAGAAPEAEGMVFRTAYNLSAGSGTLTRAPLVRGVDGAAWLLEPLWDAAAILSVTSPGARRIHTAGAAAGTTVPFEWEHLPPAHQAALDLPPGGTMPDGLGRDRMAWLRGDRALEGAMLRRRAGLLGDAVHGTPLHIGAAAHPHGDAAYRAFREWTLRRTPAVYLGANDGMLHAFDAGTGAELFAYVPAMLWPALNELPAPDYRHRAYVDGPLAAGEALIGGAWRSVLVAATGAGAQGLFALDVTDPAAFGAGLGALWEFTPRDDAVIGNVTQPARVARMKVRIRYRTPEYRYFAVAGNGVNSAAGGGALLLLALDKPPSEPWRLEANYYRLDTPPGDPALPAGLGGPALVMDDAQLLRHAYAGDLQGRLWRFDFTRSAPWRSDPAMQPVFVARDPAGRAQPITQPPTIVHAEGGGYLVLFGTGSLHGREERDPARFTPQSYYAVYDDPSATARPAPLDRADLAERLVDAAAGDAHAVVSGRPVSAGPGNRPRGWFLDFAAGAATGERSLDPGTIADGRLVFTTVVPGRDPCADSGSRRYVLDALTGLPVDASGTVLARGMTGVLVPGLVHGAPLLLAGPRTRMVRDPAGRIRVARETAIVHAASTGPVTERTSASWPAGRLSWREVANWRQLHRAASGGERP